MEFAKLHGTGNDFVVIDARGVERDWPALARRMCDRHFGVGADGLILATGSAVAPVRMRILEAEPPVRRVDLQANGRTLAITPVSMGNPHAVHFQQAPVAEFPLEALGPLVEHHELFPNRANFEVIRMLGKDTAEMRVWERGVGE